MKSIGESDSFCSHLKNFIPERVCSTPLQARTEVTPRANPNDSNIISVLEPTGDGSKPSLSEKMLYEGPDVLNPSLMVPSDEINVHDIIINRRRELFEWQANFDYEFDSNGAAFEIQGSTVPKFYLRRNTGSNEIVAGKGWELDTLPGTCDGSTTAICGRQPSSDCLLYGHMNYDGGLVGDESSGWLVMNLSDVAKGIVMIKVETALLPDNFSFDYALDNTSESLSKESFIEKTKTPQDKVDLITLLDDPSFASEDDKKNIKFSIRLKNCKDECRFKITHIYWA